MEYTAEEVATWRHVLTRLSELHARHACAQYLRAFPMLGFSPDVVGRERVVRPQAGVLQLLLMLCVCVCVWWCV